MRIDPGKIRLDYTLDDEDTYVGWLVQTATWRDPETGNRYSVRVLTDHQGDGLFSPDGHGYMTCHVALTQYGLPVSDYTLKRQLRAAWIRAYIDVRTHGFEGRWRELSDMYRYVTDPDVLEVGR